MQQRLDGSIRWTVADLELLSDDGNRYEIVEGELFVSRAPNWKHQRVCTRLVSVLDHWSRRTGQGTAAVGPGLLFDEVDNVIPDVVWVSSSSLPLLLDASGHLIGAPDLVVEVLSPGALNERRDREVKLKLYSVRGAQEYWLVDPLLQRIEIYRREQAVLRLVVTLLVNDTLDSPLLPDFACPVGELFD